AAGKAQAVLFDPQMSARAMERWALENDLRYALARDELRLYYQPIFDLHHAGVVGTEALLRWEHPQRGLLEPEVFIPLAEETGLIIPIGTWVLEEACGHAHAMRRAGGVPIVMSINLSARQLQQ